jgi:hypothetical protein
LIQPIRPPNPPGKLRRNLPGHLHFFQTHPRLVSNTIRQINQIGALSRQISHDYNEISDTEQFLQAFKALSKGEREAFEEFVSSTA